MTRHRLLSCATVRFTESPIEGVFVIEPAPAADDRGVFVKVFNSELFARYGLQSRFEEVFFSESKKGVIRGFHFQTPPMALEKLAWVTHGEILDVVVDLRTRSRTYGQCFSTVLSEQNRNIVYVPVGVGHAFCVLSDSATVLYETSRVFSPAHDAGIRWSSVGFAWPVDHPVISKRDAELPPLDEFVSPF